MHGLFVYVPLAYPKPPMSAAPGCTSHGAYIGFTAS